MISTEISTIIKLLEDRLGQLLHHKSDQYREVIQETDIEQSPLGLKLPLA